MSRTYTPSQIADGLLAGKFVRETEFMLAFEVERLTRERDEARAKSAKMREALRKFECMCIGDQCDSYGQPYQPQCERYMARKLVESKP